MSQNKYFISLTQDAQQIVSESPSAKHTYKRKNYGFEAVSISIEHPFLLMNFEEREKRTFSLYIPLNWVRYIASATGGKFPGF